VVFKISDDRMRDWSGVISAIHNCPNQLIKRLDWSDPHGQIETLLFGCPPL